MVIAEVGQLVQSFALVVASKLIEVGPLVVFMEALAPTAVEDLFVVVAEVSIPNAEGGLVFEPIVAELASELVALVFEQLDLVFE